MFVGFTQKRGAGKRLFFWQPFFVIVSICAVASRAVAEPIVQQAQSYIDDQGCLVFEATARVDQPIDDLSNVMARPEAVYSHSDPYSVRARVFIGFPWNAGTYIQNPSNSWSVTHPSSKILELTAILGRSGAMPQRWIEYGFDWNAHVISEHDLAATDGWSVYRPAFRAQYVLSPSDDSTTTVKYTSTRCFGDADRPKVAQKKIQWTESEKRSFTTWLGRRLPSVNGSEPCPRPRLPQPRRPAPHLQLSPVRRLLRRHWHFHR
jgi:hypothetical protein